MPSEVYYASRANLVQEPEDSKHIVKGRPVKYSQYTEEIIYQERPKKKKNNKTKSDTINILYLLFRKSFSMIDVLKEHNYTN